jgi:hypothetical protein
MKARCLPICLLLSSIAAWADGPVLGPIETDRPDQTESASVVPRGLVQIEAGYVFTRLKPDEGVVSEISQIPATLIRYGLSETFELRFDWAGYVNEERQTGSLDEDESGSGNTAVGAKIKLREERGAAPQLAILINFILPTGEKAFRSERIDPSLRVLGAHTLSERLSLGWNAGVTLFTLEDPGLELDTFAAASYTAALGIGVSERWGSFVELFGLIPFSGSPGNEHAFDAGFTYLAQDNLQLDVYAGVGLNDRAIDRFGGVGFSVRLPR